jgi:hypothetical protein
MILPRYRISPSKIPGAGKGLFLEEPVVRGRVMVAPDAIPSTRSYDEILASPERDTLLPSSIRWFEDHYTTTPDWPDECYMNHSFEPVGIWHLGFVFANADLPVGTEITVDYRHLLKEGEPEVFVDQKSGRPIIGLPWAESLRLSTEQLLAAIR